MYEFGGVYLDLDNIALKPLDYWTYTHDAVLTHENYEHSYFSHKRSKPHIINSFMAAKPKHEFFKLLIDNLKAAADKHKRRMVDAVLHATGPFFVTELLEKYQSNVSNNLSSDVTVLPPKYFVPVMDLSVRNVQAHCQHQMPDPQTHPHQYQVCRRILRPGYMNAITSDAFVTHKWVHTYSGYFPLRISKIYKFDVYKLDSRIHSYANVSQCS